MRNSENDYGSAKVMRQIEKKIESDVSEEEIVDEKVVKKSLLSKKT